MIEEHDHQPITWGSFLGGLSGIFLALVISYVTAGLFGGNEP